MVTRRDFIKFTITAAIAPTAFASVMAPKPAYGETYLVFKDFSLIDYKEKPITLVVPREIKIGNIWLNGREAMPNEYTIKRC